MFKLSQLRIPTFIYQRASNHLKVSRNNLLSPVLPKLLFQHDMRINVHNTLCESEKRMERLSRHIDLIKSSLSIDKNKIIVPTFRNIRKIGGIRSRRKDAAFQCSVSINVPSVISVKACGKGLTKELAKKSAIDVFIRTTSFYTSKSSTSNGRLAQSQSRRTLAVQSHYSAVGVNVLRELRRQYSQNATETKVPEQQKTVASTGLQRRDSEESSVTKEEEERTVHHDDSTFDQSYKDLLRVYPQPTSRLKNFFDVFEKNLGKKMCKTSSKLNKSRAWEYKYKVDWPEPAEFVGVSASKKEAARRGALQVLKWLKDLGKIDLKGNLFTVNRKEFLREENKKPLATIRLNEDFVDETEWLMQEYDQVFSGPIQEAISQWDSTEMPFNFDTGSQKRNFSESESVLERRNRDLLLSLENRKQSNSEKLKLPITEYGAQIVDLVRKNPVVVIKGEPGCGKSTQVPQLIFEDYTERMEATKCNIVVTQPRKISAISIAERIADERYEELGNVVGYQVRMGSVLPRFNDGYIILCTLGVMLRKLLSPDGMRGITHLIIDEAHERDLNTDILLLLSKRAIKNNPDLRIIIMSATINPELFQNYFNNAPSLLVPGFTHPVTSRFLDRAMQKELGLTAAELKKGSDQQPDIDSRVIAKAVHWVAANRPPGAILVFLPGWDTISKVRDELEGHPRLAVLPVHSRLSHDDQRRIFQRPPAGRRKVVLATNIAETSITINDVVYVIDSGLLKEKRLNSRDGMSCLDNHWASKASVIQRKGRAGRVQSGECYHLYSQQKFDSLDEFPMPEVHRIRLEMVVLQSKTYSGHEEAEQFLRQLPEPPSVSVIREAVKTLQFMGALDMEENLTALGHRISVFTTHPLISKALVYSYFFKCVNPLITIGTIMSSERDLFPGMGVDKSLIRVGKARFSPSSDHLAMAWLFQQWSEYQTRDERRARSLMEEMLGNHNAFLFIQQLQLLVADHLRQCNISPKSSVLFNKRAECNEYAVNDELIKGVFLAGVGNLLIHKKYQIKKGVLKKSSSLVTMNGNPAMITSESVNHKRSDFPSPLTTYFQEMHSAQMRIAMIRETSIVSPLTVALFQPGIITTMKPIEENKNAAGDVMIQLRSKKNLNFSCDMRTAKAIMKLRRAMWDVMGYFVMECGNPRDPQLYRDVNIFHDKVLILLNKMLLEAGTNIDYDEDGNLRKRFQNEVSLTADQLSAVFESLDTCASGFLTLDQFLAGVSNFGNGSILGNNEDYIANNFQTDNDQIVRNIINLSMLNRSGSLLQKLNTLIQDSVTEEIDKPWRHFIQELGIDMQRLKEQTEELERVLAARDRRHEEEIQKLFDELENQLSEEKEKMSIEIDTREKSLRLEMREKLDAKDRLISEVLTQRDEALASLYDLQVHDNNVKLENVNLQKLKDEYQKEIKQQQEVILRLQGELENTKAEEEAKCKSCFHQGFLLAQKLAVAEENGLLQQLAMIKEMQSILKNNYNRKKVEFVDVSGT